MSIALEIRRKQDFDIVDGEGNMISNWERAEFLDRQMRVIFLVKNQMQSRDGSVITKWVAV